MQAPKNTQSKDSDLRQTEEKLRLFRDSVENSSDAVGMSTPTGKHYYQNNAFDELFGSIGENPPENLYVDPAVGQEVFRTIMAGGVWTGEVKMYARDRRVLTILLRAYASKDQSGRIGVLVGVHTDITERKQAEEAFRELNATLEQRVAERTAEVQQRSRQLALLASELTLVEQRERRRLADYLHDHVQQLLVGARMQAHTLSASTPQPQRAAVDELSKTLTEAIEAARNVSREIGPPIAVFGHLSEALQWLVRDVKKRHNLRVKASFRGELRDVPEAPSILLFTAAREMLFNVVKHAGVLDADLELVTEGNAVVLRVSDCGCGMASAHLTSPESRGFGLFSIRERSESMGGSLTTDSIPGRGMRVTVRFPLAAVPAARRKPRKRQKQAETVAQAKPQEGSAGSGRIRVLFVDDHQIVRESLVSLLDGQTEVEAVGQCGDGQQAVEQAGRLRPDVVIMDVSMPVMDGVEATRRIKERWPGIKVIGLSMFDDADGGGKMRAAGADGYVSKSGPPEELIKAIRQCARAGCIDEMPTAGSRSARKKRN